MSRKRTREEKNSLVPVEPLKCDGPLKTLDKITTDSGFTIADLAVVLSTMQKLFGLEYSFTGPCEGSIQIANFPVDTWQKKRNGEGIWTELRFGSYIRTQENMTCLDNIFNGKRHHIRLELTDTNDDTIQKCLNDLPNVRRRCRMMPEDMRRVMKEQFSVRLKHGYPYYSWPRWLFGVFKGLVMRRAQLDSFVPDAPFKDYRRLQSLNKITRASGFTVADLAVVLGTMQKLFGLKYLFSGPSEGSIEIDNCPLYTWQNWTQKKKTGGQGHSELRFCCMWNESEKVRCLDKLFTDVIWDPDIKQATRRRHPELFMLTDTNDDIISKCKDEYLRCYSCQEMKDTEEDVLKVLKMQMPIDLKFSYPYYSWPLWIFDTFEGLVMRRVQLNEARKVTSQDPP